MLTLKSVAVAAAVGMMSSQLLVSAQRGPQRGYRSSPGTTTTTPPAPSTSVPTGRPAPAGPGRTRGGGRLFAAQDLGLLESPDREQWQKPEQIMDALRIADGSVVAEIGAAGGWFTIRLARRVGPNGVVYAEDIQQEMIERIERRIKQENLPWVRPVLGTANDPRLPSGIDAILIAETFAEMQLPPTNPVQLLRKTAESLKPDGRIGVVDFNPGGGGPGPAADQRVDPSVVISTATAAGLKLIAREAVPPFQYLLVFEKAAATRSNP